MDFYSFGLETFSPDDCTRMEDNLKDLESQGNWLDYHSCTQDQSVPSEQEQPADGCWQLKNKSFKTQSKWDTGLLYSSKAA